MCHLRLTTRAWNPLLSLDPGNLKAIDADSPGRGLKTLEVATFGYGMVRGGIFLVKPSAHGVELIREKDEESRDAVKEDGGNP